VEVSGIELLTSCMICNLHYILALFSALYTSLYFNSLNTFFMF